MDTVKNKTISSLPLKLIAAMVLLCLLELWHSLDIIAAVRECGDTFLVSGYALLAVALTAASIFAVIMLHSDKTGFTITMSILIFIMGAGNVYVFRGLSAPDEVSHYVSAYKLSNSILGKPVCDEYGRAYVRACDLYLEDMYNKLDEVREAADAGVSTDAGLKVFGQTLDESVYKVYADGVTGDLRSKEESGISCQWSVNTTPIAYLPQAVGISLARLMGLNSLWLLTLGKLCNLIFFTLMCALSMYLMPRAKEIIAGVCLIPETLHLAGSMSYDVFVMACSFVYIALIANIAERGYSKRKIIAAALIIGALAPCKLIYSLLLMLLITLIPRRSRKEQEAVSDGPGKSKQSMSGFVILAGLCIITVCIAMYMVNASTIGNYAAADERIISWAEDAQGYTVSYLLHRPLELIRICYQSLLIKTGNWFATMFGLYLGNQDPVLNVPYPIIGLYSMGLFLLAAGSEIKSGGFVKAVNILTFAAVMAALMGSMLIAYTPMSSAYIEGVQGRYLLPVLPLLLMSIPGSWIKLKPGMGREMLVMFVIAESYVLIRVYATVAMRL